MIFDILKDGLDYVGTNRNQIILYYLGILFFPLIMIESYSYYIIENCLDGIINNKDKLPDLTINQEVFIKGFKLLILKIIYYLPEIIILVIACNLKQINWYYLITILMVLMILSYFLSQIASVCMVESGLFKEGLNFTKIFNILKTVGITYVELIIAMLIIILGIIGVTAIISGIIIFLSSISGMLQIIFILLLVIAYIIFLITIIPIYVLFKNRAVTSIYNLS